jgi:hypothetical protein
MPVTGVPWPPTVEIVHIAIAVVVEVVVGNLIKVAPDVVAEVGVVKIEAVVDDAGHDGIAKGGEAARCEIPGFICVDVGIYDTTGGAGVDVLPLLGKSGVVGCGGALLDEVVVLGDGHAGVAVGGGEDGGCIGFAVKAQQPHMCRGGDFPCQFCLQSGKALVEIGDKTLDGVAGACLKEEFAGDKRGLFDLPKSGHCAHAAGKSR